MGLWLYKNQQCQQLAPSCTKMNQKTSAVRFGAAKPSPTLQTSGQASSTALRAVKDYSVDSIAPSDTEVRLMSWLYPFELRMFSISQYDFFGICSHRPQLGHGSLCFILCRPVVALVGKQTESCRGMTCFKFLPGAQGSSYRQMVEDRPRASPLWEFCAQGPQLKKCCRKSVY